jgi:hypothetical protein
MKRKKTPKQNIYIYTSLIVCCHEKKTNGINLIGELLEEINIDICYVN